MDWSTLTGGPSLACQRASRAGEFGAHASRGANQQSIDKGHFFGHARCERTLEARGSRHGVRPRRPKTAEGELEVQEPQLRNMADRFDSQIVSDTRTVTRTRPLEVRLSGRGLPARHTQSPVEMTA